MTRGGMVFSIDAVCPSGVEEVEGAAIYWQGTSRLTPVSANGVKATAIPAETWSSPGGMCTTNTAADRTTLDRGDE
jgi:hypothetical protein